MGYPTHVFQSSMQQSHLKSKVRLKWNCPFGIFKLFLQIIRCVAGNDI